MSEKSYSFSDVHDHHDASDFVHHCRDSILWVAISSFDDTAIDSDEAKTLRKEVVLVSVKYMVHLKYKRWLGGHTDIDIDKKQSKQRRDIAAEYNLEEHHNLDNHAMDKTSQAGAKKQKWAKMRWRTRLNNRMSKRCAVENAHVSDVRTRKDKEVEPNKKRHAKQVGRSVNRIALEKMVDRDIDQSWNTNEPVLHNNCCDSMAQMDLLVIPHSRDDCQHALAQYWSWINHHKQSRTSKIAT